MKLGSVCGVWRTVTAAVWVNSYDLRTLSPNLAFAGMRTLISECAFTRIELPRRFP